MNPFFLEIFRRIAFWFPILLFIYIKDDIDVYKVIGNIILALFLIFASNIFTNNKVNRFVEIAGIVFFNVIMFVQIGHFYLFKDIIAASTFFIIFDTNISEAKDFLSMYIDWGIMTIIILLTLVCSISIFLSVKNSYKEIKPKYSFAIIFFLFIVLLNNQIRGNTFPHIFYSAVKDYRYEKEMFNKVTENKLGGDFSNVMYNGKSNEEISVLIIGESTTRDHMQLYGYYRKTNPKLNKIKEDLLIYNDIISPNTHTVPSLNKVLTLASHEFPSRKYDGSLIQLFNKGGFKTYWLSNQKPMGLYDTNVTIFSKNCDEQIFVNATYYSLDERVLPPLKKILNQKSAKKFIVIHLMGSHGEYENRYPPTFQKFDSKPRTSFEVARAFKLINTYDNSVLYNDFIVNEIIREVKAINAKSYVLYLSDHGEEVYQTMALKGHTETIGTKPMFDIPFILWRSKKFKLEEEKFVYDTNRKYISEDLIYTLSDLSSLTWKEFDSTKSLVNKNFVSRKRIVSRKNIDYDAFFHHKK
ncbi:sulfatase-like hydrolase/transferase [Kaistella solincola]|uniref:sulfatase-like hydrolase/transferase n=1 Tax=Kaistella solincola TaxID=510955 RepID=UPI00068E71B3|nr:sulfatase-like hydrolase/transferase [Kaistella solincola]